MPDTDPPHVSRLTPRKPPDLSPYHVRNDALGDLTGKDFRSLERMRPTDVSRLNRLPRDRLVALVLLCERRVAYPPAGATYMATEWLRQDLDVVRSAVYRRDLEAERDARLAAFRRPLLPPTPEPAGDADWAGPGDDDVPDDAPDDREDCSAVRSDAPPPGDGSAVRRADPSNRLFSAAGRGRVTAVPEWVRAFVPAVLARRKEDGLATRGACVGNLILALAQLSYWSEPGADGSPRATGDNRRRVDGVWWLRLSPAALGRQTGLGTRATRAAVDRLVEYGILEERTGGGGYGPNTKWVRVRWEDVEPAVEKLRAAGKTRRDGST